MHHVRRTSYRRTTTDTDSNGPILFDRLPVEARSRLIGVPHPCTDVHVSIAAEGPPVLMACSQQMRHVAIDTKGHDMTSGTIPTWDRYPGPPPAVYERHFVPAIALPFAEQVIDASRPRPGERVLDVACGTGIVARMAAACVGDDNLAAGIDGHPAMLATARSISPDIDWRQASAEGLPFDDDTFDVVLCSLGLQFFADKVRSLDEMHRVLRPTGRVAIATVGPTPEPFRVLHDVLAEHLGDEAAAFVDAVFALDDADHLGQLMNAAGLANVDTTRRSIGVQVDPPADFLWQYLLGTPLAEQVAGLATERRAALERAVVDAWQESANDRGLCFEVDVVLGTATANA